MTLTLHRIARLMFGQAEHTAEDGLRGYKCTASLRDAWGALAPFLKTYATHSTGIRLDFHTDAEEVTFLLSGGRFEAFCDGNFVAFGGKEGNEQELLRLALPAGEHRVTLWFPSLQNGAVHGMTISDGATLRPHEYRRRILFLGDSVTQGCYADPDTESFAIGLSRHWDADCIIHGVGGAYFHPSVFEAPQGFTPDLVLIALGTNDFSWGHTPEQMREFTAAYLDRAVEAYGKEKIVCILPIWRDESRISSDLRDLFPKTVEMIRTEEAKRGLRILDGLTLIPHEARFFSEDLLHPNTAGFREYTKNLIAALESKTL